MVGSITSPFQWSKVLNKPDALMSKVLIAREGKAWRARGCGRVTNLTPPCVGAVGAN